jgi:plastocyanin
MFRGICILALLLLAWLSALASPDIPATTAPSTRPQGAITGKVQISSLWNLHKPDLAHVVVYLASNPVLDAVPCAVNAAEVAQRDKAFVPRFLVIARATTVDFPNWDHFDHNVFSRSKAAPAFDLDRYAYGMSKSRQFQSAGVIQVFCNIHPEMRAIIFVTPNPFFTRVDADGNFTIPGVPSGEYDLIVWNDRCKQQQQHVSVSADQPPPLSFTLEEDRQSILTFDPPQKNSYGVERGLNAKQQRLDLPVVQEVHPAPQPPPPPDSQ